MKNKRKYTPFFFGMLILSVFVLSGFVSTTVNAQAVSPQSNPAVEDLTETEVDGLIYMREEEKLARDLYLALYEQWGLPLFQNIAGSEQTHTDAVKHLLDVYGIADPAEDTAGIFTNPDLQALYDELIATGSRSLADALKVGAAIEEIDILDLRAALEEATNPEVRQVYENLLKGSENHLRAFTAILPAKLVRPTSPNI